MPQAKSKIVRRLLKAKTSEIPAWMISLANGSSTKAPHNADDIIECMTDDVERVVSINKALTNITPIKSSKKISLL